MPRETGTRSEAALIGLNTNMLHQGDVGLKHLDETVTHATVFETNMKHYSKKAYVACKIRKICMHDLDRFGRDFAAGYSILEGLKY